VTENLPNTPNGGTPHNQTGQGNNYHLNVDQVSISVSDIDAYRRLANENGVDFARDVMRAQDRKHARENRSTIIGMVTAGLTLVCIMAAVTIAIVYLGWWQSLLVALILLACSHFLRVLLTGEWSETSWFGKFIAGKSPPTNEQ
jgi:hypothetical protein